MNNSTTNNFGTLNIARLIEEAEAQLIGEHNNACSSCGNCKSERSHFSGRCADRGVKTSARRELTSANA
jgi:hypothetical protein